MKIATWNINGVKARIANLCEWLKSSAPDIVCLQEIKSEDATFPRLEIEALGYHVETYGQKGFNGVALLSKMKPDEVNRGLPDGRWRRTVALHRRRFLSQGRSAARSARYTCRTAIPPTIR
jgi:Exodeoxyribonuclease III (EC 3.1.11.2)